MQCNDMIERRMRQIYIYSSLILRGVLAERWEQQVAGEPPVLRVMIIDSRYWIVVLFA